MDRYADPDAAAARCDAVLAQLQSQDRYLSQSAGHPCEIKRGRRPRRAGPPRCERRRINSRRARGPTRRCRSAARRRWIDCSAHWRASESRRRDQGCDQDRVARTSADSKRCRWRANVGYGYRAPRHERHSAF